MSRLIPERRVNKNGVVVTKHVRANTEDKGSSFLSRVFPAVAKKQARAEEAAIAAEIAATETARREEIFSSFQAVMKREEAEKEKERDERIRLETDPTQKSMLIMSKSLHMHTSFSGYDSVASQLSKFKDYSLDTMERIYSAAQGADNVTDLLSSYPENETILRAALNFPEHKIHALYADKVFEDVAASTGVDDLSSLPPGSDAHNLVSAVFDVAIRAHEDRAKVHYAEEADKKRRMLIVMHSDAWIREEKMRTQMTRSLASVIVENPTRVDDIVEYMRSRKIEPADVDGGHLDVYLNDVAARSLADGAL